MLVELAVVAAVLVVGNIAFQHFEPQTPVWRRVLKALIILGVTAVISNFFGRTGVIFVGALAALPVLYIHAVWLPRHGVNGWTGEPRAKYHALRGWPPPKN